MLGKNKKRKSQSLSIDTISDDSMYTVNCIVLVEHKKVTAQFNSHVSVCKVEMYSPKCQVGYSMILTNGNTLF